jgi:hypothetical protein
MNKDNITISSDDVKDFKVTYCDENPIIIDLLKKDFLGYFNEPVLDVGGGTGDILSVVIPEKKVIHLDVLDFSDVPVSEAHTRITGDFFDSKLIDGLKPIKTMFMSHVHQFIDADLQKLKDGIDYVDAKRIILVEDMNDDFLGEVMRFSLEHLPNANPEVKIEGFPFGYAKVKSVPFTATLTSPTFLELTKQCLYLMDTAHSEQNIKLISDFLQANLKTPTFTINQEINVYEK